MAKTCSTWLKFVIELYSPLLILALLLMGLMNSTSLDDLIKCTRPPWHVTNEHRRAINKSIQYFGQLPNSWQTVGASSKPIFIGPESITKRTIKLQLMPPTARNHEAVYTHSDQRQIRYIDSPKSIHRYSDIRYSLIIL